MFFYFIKKFLGIAPRKNPIICVDFDGVIHSYKSGWKGEHVIPDEPVEGAIAWLRNHLPLPEALGGNFSPRYEGPIVQIYSSRSKSFRGRMAMKQWLINHGLEPQYIWDDILEFPVKKPAAFLTIDDRVVCFNGTFPTTEQMLEFLPWYKREIPRKKVTITRRSITEQTPEQLNSTIEALRQHVCGLEKKRDAIYAALKLPHDATEETVVGVIHQLKQYKAIVLRSKS